MSGLDLFGHALGAFGAGCIVLAYFLLQIGRIDAKSAVYSAVNLIGAIALLVSLLIHFNLGGFLIEGFWIAISLYGLAKALKRSSPTD